MNEAKTCPKCKGTMVTGSDQNLNDNFRCTRPLPESQKRRQLDYKVQPYCCEDCGYIEFYKEK